MLCWNKTHSPTEARQFSTLCVFVYVRGSGGGPDYKVLIVHMMTSCLPKSNKTSQSLQMLWMNECECAAEFGLYSVFAVVSLLQTRCWSIRGHVSSVRRRPDLQSWSQLWPTSVSLLRVPERPCSLQTRRGRWNAEAQKTHVRRSPGCPACLNWSHLQLWDDARWENSFTAWVQKKSNIGNNNLLNYLIFYIL